MKERIERRGGQYDLSEVSKLEEKIREITI